MPSSAAERVHFVTVNTDAAQGKEVGALLKETVKSEYHLVHVANCESITVVKHILQSLVTTPRVLICSSRWYDDEKEEIREIAQRILPGIQLIMIPPSVNDKDSGEGATVEYLVEQITQGNLPTIKK